MTVLRLYWERPPEDLLAEAQCEVESDDFIVALNINLKDVGSSSIISALHYGARRAA